MSWAFDSTDSATASTLQPLAPRLQRMPPLLQAAVAQLLQTSAMAQLCVWRWDSSTWDALLSGSALALAAGGAPADAAAVSESLCHRSASAQPSPAFKSRYTLTAADLGSPNSRNAVAVSTGKRGNSDGRRERSVGTQSAQQRNSLEEQAARRLRV